MDWSNGAIGGAVFDACNWYWERTVLPEHRRYLARGVQGPVLDLGAGTGAMFPYIAAAAQRDGPVRMYGIEPDSGFRARAEQKAERFGLQVDIRSGRAESLPYEDGSFETVIASTVFCTIPDVEQALREVERVLVAGGELRFFEHVRSHGRHGQVQDWIAPVWKRLAAGCHLNRSTERILSKSSLEIVEVEDVELDATVTPIRRFVRGTATKTA